MINYRKLVYGLLPNKVVGVVASNEAILQDFVWRALQTVSRQAVLTILLFFSARLLLPDEFGLLSYYLAALSLIVIFCNFGFSTATTRFVAEFDDADNNKRDQVLVSSIIFIVFTVSLASLLLFMYGSSLFNVDTRLIVVFIPYLYLVPISNIIDGYFRGVRLFKQLFSATLAGGIVSLILGIYLISRFSLFGAVVAQSVVYLSVTLFLLPAFRHITISFNIEVIKKVLRYSIVLGLVNLSYFLYSRVDVFVLKHFGYIVEIGHYEILNRTFQLVLMPSILFGQVIAPNVSKLMASQKIVTVKSKYIKYMQFMLLTGVIIACGLLLVGPVTVKVLLPQYATDQFLLIGLILLFLFPIKWWSAVMTNGFIIPAGYARVSLLVTLIAGIVNVLLDYFAVLQFGFIGVFIVTLIVHGATNTIISLWILSLLKRDSSPI